MKKKTRLLIALLFILLSNLNVYAASVSCDDVLGRGLVKTINDNFFVPLRVIAPILLLAFTTFDFVKVVFSDDSKNFAKAGQNFLKRSIATLIVFFAPNIVAFILGFVEGAGLCTGF